MRADVFQVCLPAVVNRRYDAPNYTTTGRRAFTLGCNAQISRSLLILLRVLSEKKAAKRNGREGQG